MSDIKVRVGQQNAIKVVSSISGSAGGQAISAITAENVIGGIASVSQLNVTGVSTFVDIATFESNVYIGENARIGLSTIGGIYLENPNSTSIYGMTYLDSSGSLNITAGAASSSINYSNYIMTTDYNNVPVWTTVIDGGTY